MFEYVEFDAEEANRFNGHTVDAMQFATANALAHALGHEWATSHSEFVERLRRVLGITDLEVGVADYEGIYRVLDDSLSEVAPGKERWQAGIRYLTLDVDDNDNLVIRHGSETGRLDYGVAHDRTEIRISRPQGDVISLTVGESPDIWWSLDPKKSRIYPTYLQEEEPFLTGYDPMPPSTTARHVDALARLVSGPVEAGLWPRSVIADVHQITVVDWFEDASRKALNLFRREKANRRRARLGYDSFAGELPTENLPERAAALAKAIEESWQ